MFIIVHICINIYVYLLNCSNNLYEIEEDNLPEKTKNNKLNNVISKIKFYLFNCMWVSLKTQNFLV